MSIVIYARPTGRDTMEITLHAPEKGTMIELDNPRIVTVTDELGFPRESKLDVETTLGEALHSADINLSPSWLRVVFDWEGDAMLTVAAAYVTGNYFMPWKIHGSPLTFGAETNGNDLLKRYTGTDVDDFDCGVQNYLWGLPPEASGLVFGLALEKGQPTRRLSELGEIYVRIDADNNTLDEHDAPQFTPLMSMICNVKDAREPAAIVAGLFIGTTLRYGQLPEKDPGAIGYYLLGNSGPRAGNLQLRQVQSQASALAALMG